MTGFDFTAYFLNPTFSDFEIHVDEEIYYTHKIVLASRSTHFASFFADHQTSRRLTLKDASSAAVLLVLKYIYTGVTTADVKNEDTLLEVLQLSRKYFLIELENAALEEIKQFQKSRYNLLKRNSLTDEKLFLNIGENKNPPSSSDAMAIGRSSFEEVITKSKHSTTVLRKSSKQAAKALKTLQKEKKKDSKQKDKLKQASSNFEGPITRSKQNERLKTKDVKFSTKSTRISKKQTKVIKDHDESSTTSKPFKITTSHRNRNFGLVVFNLNDLIHKVQETLKLFNIAAVVLEDDGTEISDEEYFATLDLNTKLMVLEEGQKWTPATRSQELDVDVVDHPGSELVELIGKIKNNVCHVSLLRNAELELLTEMEPKNAPHFDQAFLKSLRDTAGRYLSEKRDAQEALELLRLYRKHRS